MMKNGYDGSRTGPFLLTTRIVVDDTYPIMSGTSRTAPGAVRSRPVCRARGQGRGVAQGSGLRFVEWQVC